MTIETPQKISLLDELAFNITGDKYINPGQNYIGEIYFNEPNENETITFSWGDNEITFVFKNNPDGSGLQLPAYNSSAYGTYLLILLFYLKVNYYLFNLYNISINSNKIRFEAKKKGTDYQFAITSDVSGLTHTITQNAIDIEYKPFYKIGMSIYDADYNFLGEDILSVDNNNSVKFNLTEYAKNTFNNIFTREVNITDYIVITDFLKKFNFRYYEFYGTNPERKALLSENDYYLIKGNLDKFNFALNSERNTNFKEYIETKKIFLTNQNRTKTVNYYQHERLFFLVLYSTEIRFYAQFLFDDDSLSLPYQIEAKTVYQNNIIELITSPKKIIDKYNNATGNDKDVRKIIFFLRDSNETQISEYFYFLIDYNFYEHERFFIFENSLGTFDTIRFKGVAQKETSYKITDISSFYNETLTTDFEKNKKRGTESENYKVNSGWLKDRDEANYFRELFLSDKVFEIVGDYYLPVKIMSSKSKIFIDENYNYSIDIEYQRTNDNDYYSNIFEKDILGGTIFDPNGFGDGFDTGEEANER